MGANSKENCCARTLAGIAGCDAPAKTNGFLHMSAQPQLPYKSFKELLPEVRERFGGRYISLGTIHNWHKIGVRGHKLHAVKMGGKLLTSSHWLDAFFAALNSPAPAAPETPSVEGEPCLA